MFMPLTRYLHSDNLDVDTVVIPSTTSRPNLNFIERSFLQGVWVTELLNCRQESLVKMV